MKDLTFLILDLLTALAKLLPPGGSRAVIADNLLLKEQLTTHNTRQVLKILSVSDRILVLEGL